MNELSKKLKELGFGDGSFGSIDGTKIPVISGMSLTELMAACGRTHTEKNKKYEFALIFSNREWFAGYWDENLNRPQLNDGRALTPEEAVANLLLELTT